MYKKIMVPLDGSKLAECVLPHVEAFISQCQTRTIIFIRVIESIRPAVAGISLEQLEIREVERKSVAEKYLKQIISRLTSDETKRHLYNPFDKETKVNGLDERRGEARYRNDAPVIFQVLSALITEAYWFE